MISRLKCYDTAGLGGQRRAYPLHTKFKSEKTLTFPKSELEETFKTSSMHDSVTPLDDPENYMQTKMDFSDSNMHYLDRSQRRTTKVPCENKNM